MKVLLIEDDLRKRNAITKYLTSKKIAEKDILFAKNMTDFAAYLGAEIGLFIIDFYIPNLDGAQASNNGAAILQAIIKAGKSNALLLAISSYPDEFPDLRKIYESHGCILANFRETKSWQSTLDHLIIQLAMQTRMDFLIFCALLEERNPYAIAHDCKQVIRNGVDCLDLEILGKKGTVVLLPQMGLVNAAITAAVCIERFKPKFVGMSGICGGFPDRAALGQLFISGTAYEYQSGKWASDGFKGDPYQVQTDHLTLVAMKAFANSPNLIVELEAGFNGVRPANARAPEVAVFTSGSAVIASKEYMQQVSLVHRKVAALDMEIFAIARAAELSPHKPVCICAKTVVDLCNAKKNNDLHAYGSYISAKFMTSAIKKVLTPA